jgi:uncharacterized protein (DUF486 family)
MVVFPAVAVMPLGTALICCALELAANRLGMDTITAEIQRSARDDIILLVNQFFQRYFSPM